MIVDKKSSPGYAMILTTEVACYTKDIMDRDLHPVSAKIAIYTPDRTKVLLTEYVPGKYGLPGGHLDAGEAPEEALIRELHEELSISLTPAKITRRDFWRHNNSKIVLGFTAILPENTPVILDPAEVYAIRWTPIDDIRSGAVTAGDYDQFILGAA